MTTVAENSVRSVAAMMNAARSLADCGSGGFGNSPCRNTSGLRRMDIATRVLAFHKNYRVRFLKSFVVCFEIEGGLKSTTFELHSDRFGLVFRVALYLCAPAGQLFRKKMRGFVELKL